MPLMLPTLTDQLRAADESWNVGTISTVIVSILRTQPKLTLLDIEDAFRALPSKTTFLVAWPLEHMPPQLTARRIDGTRAKYAVWFCINGEGDMIRQLRRFGLTLGENREALRECGFAMVGLR